MNALSPSDLLSDVFGYCGSVTATSAAWKSDAIANLEARLAVQWAADRQREKGGPADIVFNHIGKARHQAQFDRAVWEAIEDCETVDEITAVLRYGVAPVQTSLRRLIRAGFVQFITRDGSRVYSQVEGREPRMDMRSYNSATEASVKARKAIRSKKHEMMVMLKEQGHTMTEIIEKVGISKKYAYRLLREMRQ